MPIYFVFALNFLNGTAVQASRVVLPLYALELGANPFLVGLLGATFSFFPMLLAVSAGKLADRFGSRWLLVIGMTGGGLGMLLPYFRSGLLMIFAAAILMGLSTSICNVSLQNLAGLLSKPETRARNFSNYSLIGAITNTLGPLIAGFSIEHSGHAAACLYLALLAIPPVVMLLIRGGVLPGGTLDVEHSGGTSVFSTLSEPGVRRVLATGALQNSGESLYQYYMPVYMHSISLAASTIGIVLAMHSAAAFAVRLILPRLIARYKEKRVLAYAFYVGAATLLVIPFFQNGMVLALISFVFGLGMGCCSPIVTMLMFENSPAGRSGETLGLKITANHFTKVVSPIVFGAVASALGLPPVFWIDALMLGAGGLLSQTKAKLKPGIRKTADS